MVIKQFWRVTELWFWYLNTLSFLLYSWHLKAKASAILNLKKGKKRKRKYYINTSLSWSMLPFISWSACFFRAFECRKNLWVRDWNEKDQMWKYIVQEVWVWIEASRQKKRQTLINDDQVNAWKSSWFRISLDHFRIGTVKGLLKQVFPCLSWALNMQ